MLSHASQVESWVNLVKQSNLPDSGEMRVFRVLEEETSIVFFDGKTDEFMDCVPLSCRFELWGR